MEGTYRLFVESIVYVKVSRLLSSDRNVGHERRVSQSRCENQTDGAERSMMRRSQVEQASGTRWLSRPSVELYTEQGVGRSENCRDSDEQGVVVV